jgi:hypothetical protein
MWVVSFTPRHFITEESSPVPFDWVPEPAWTCRTKNTCRCWESSPGRTYGRKIVTHLEWSSGTHGRNAYSILFGNRIRRIRTFLTSHRKRVVTTGVKRTWPAASFRLAWRRCGTWTATSRVSIAYWDSCNAGGNLPALCLLHFECLAIETGLLQWTKQVGNAGSISQQSLPVHTNTRLTAHWNTWPFISILIQQVYIM